MKIARDGELLVRGRSAAQVAAWDAQVADSVAADTRSPFSGADHDDDAVLLTAFFTTRADFIDGWLAEAGHCPVIR